MSRQGGGVMAYVPDEMMRRKRNVSRSAWDVYEALCAFADSDTGVVESCHFNYPKLVEMSGVKLGTARNAMMELRKKGWRWEDDAGRIHLAGIFVIEAKRLAEERRVARAKARKASLTGETVSLGNDAPSLASDAVSPRSDARIDKERARGSTNPNQPSTNPKTNTHTLTPSHATGGVSPPDGGGVCVLFRSRCSPEQIARYARAFGLGLGWEKTARKTGADDDWIEAFDRDPEGFVAAHSKRSTNAGGSDERSIRPLAAAVGAYNGGSDEVLRDLGPAEFEELAEAVATTVEVHRRDAEAVIAELRVTEADRERMRGRFGVSGQEVVKRAGAGK
jgi:hypothetical protein